MFVTEAGVQSFQDFKLKGIYSYAIFKISDDQTCIECERTVPSGASYDEMIAAMPANEPRWVVYHLDYETVNGSRTKTVLFNWIPGGSHRVQKMMYAMWSGIVRQTLRGIHTVVQATDKSDVEYANVLERAARFEREPLLNA